MDNAGAHARPSVVADIDHGHPAATQSLPKCLAQVSCINISPITPDWPGSRTMRDGMKQRRLSRQQRQMIKSAEQLAVPVTAGAQYDYQKRSMFRSARALRDFGLVEIYRGPAPISTDARRRGPMMLALTANGFAVLATFRQQFERGSSIRWAMLAGPHSGRPAEGCSMPNLQSF